MMPEPEVPSNVQIQKTGGFDSPNSCNVPDSNASDAFVGNHTAANGARADADLHGNFNRESNFENGAGDGVKDQRKLHSNGVLNGGTVATDLNGDLYQNCDSKADNGAYVVIEDDEGRPAIGGFDRERGSHVARKESQVDSGEEGLSINDDIGTKDVNSKDMIGQPEISETSDTSTNPSDKSDTEGKHSSLKETGMENECIGNSVGEANAESETRDQVVEADQGHSNKDTSTLAEDDTRVKWQDLKSESQEVAVEDDNVHFITEASAPADDDTEDAKLNLGSEHSDGFVEDEQIIVVASAPADIEDDKLILESEHSKGNLEGNKCIITEASAPVEDDTEDGKLNLESEKSGGIVEGNEHTPTEASTSVVDDTGDSKLNLEGNERTLTEASTSAEDGTGDSKLNLESEHSNGILEGNKCIISEASAPAEDDTKGGKLDLESEQSDGTVEGNEPTLTEASTSAEDNIEDSKLNLESEHSDVILGGNEHTITEFSGSVEDHTEDGKLNLESEHCNGILGGNEHTITEFSGSVEDHTEDGKLNLESKHSDGVIEGNESETSVPDDGGKSEHSDNIIDGNECSIITEAFVSADDDSEAHRLNLESEHYDGIVEGHDHIVTEAAEAARDDTEVGKLNLESERSDGIVEADNSYDDVRVRGLDVNSESGKDVMEDDSDDKRADLVQESENRENIVEVDEECQGVEVSKSAVDGIEVGKLDNQRKSNEKVIVEEGNSKEDGSEHKGAQVSISAEDDPKVLTLVVRGEGRENIVEADNNEHESGEVSNYAGDLGQKRSIRESSTEDDNDDKRVEVSAPAENDTTNRQLDVEMSMADNMSTQNRDIIMEVIDASSDSKTEATCQDSGVNPVLKKGFELVEDSGGENVPLTSEPALGKLSTVSSGDAHVAQLNMLASKSKEHYGHNGEHTMNLSIRFGSFDVGDAEKQEVEYTAAGDQNPSSKESKNMKYYLMKIPRNDDEDLKEQIRKAQIRVHETTQNRDAIQNEIQRQKAICMEYRDNIHTAESQERDVRALYRSKRHEIDSLQSVIDLGNIDHKIRKMEHKIQHETLPLKEEKLLIREINLLRHEHKQLQSNMSKQEEVEQVLNEEAKGDGRLQHLRKELNALRNNLLKAETAAKAARKKHFDESKKLDKLREEFNAANVIRQNAYKHFLSLKEQSHERLDINFIQCDIKNLRWRGWTIVMANIFAVIQISGCYQVHKTSVEVINLLTFGSADYRTYCYDLRSIKKKLMLLFFILLVHSH